MWENFETADNQEIPISEWEQKLQKLLASSLDEEFSDYLEFKEVVQDYQSKNPGVDIMKMVDTLNDTKTTMSEKLSEYNKNKNISIPNEQGTSELFLAITEDFSWKLPVENFDELVDVLKTRYLHIIDNEVKNWVSEGNSILVSNETKNEWINNLFKNYWIENFEGYSEFKNEAQLKLDEYLLTDEWQAELENWISEEDLLKKTLILMNTQKLIDAYTKSLDNQWLSDEEKQVKINEFASAIKEQRKVIETESPELTDFLYDIKPISEPINFNDPDQFTKTLLYGHEGEQNGNVTIVGDQKVTVNEDGTFEKSILSGELELKVNLPQWIDEVDYKVALSKLKVRNDKAVEVGNILYNDIKWTEAEIKTLEASKSETWADVELIQLEIDGLVDNKKELEVKLQEVQKDLENIKKEKEFIISEYKNDVRLYQLRLHESEEKTRNVKEFLSSIGFDLIPSNVSRSILDQLNSNDALKTQLWFTTDFDLDNWVLWFEDTSTSDLLSPKEKIKFAEMYNIMISWEPWEPLRIDLISSWGWQPFEDRNTFQWILEKSGIKDSWTWITTAMNNLRTSNTENKTNQNANTKTKNTLKKV